MSAPAFSIIVPIWNVAPYLRACLESLRAQSEPSWEGLCVDDGSTDGGDAVLVQAVREEPRFRAVFQPNKGLSGARNRAFPYLRGDLVGFLDSDDLVEPWWLQEAKTCADASQADLIRFDFVRWRGAVPPPGTRSSAVTTYTTRAAVQRWGLETFVNSAFCWRYFLRRPLAQSVRFVERQRVKEDCVFGLQLLPRLTSVCESAARPYCYRMRATSLLHVRSSVDVPLGLLSFVPVFLKLDVEPSLEGWKRKHLAAFAQRAITDWATRVDRRECARYREIRAALAALIGPAGFTFRELVRPYWRPAFALFLRFGWVFPLRAHSFVYRASLVMLWTAQRLFSRG